jgi:hypothetical protein
MTGAATMQVGQLGRPILSKVPAGVTTCLRPPWWRRVIGMCTVIVRPMAIEAAVVLRSVASAAP